jgi:sporulation protein YlmC with PRC-barrel domain
VKKRGTCALVAVFVGFLLAGNSFALEPPQSVERAAKAPDMADQSGHRARASELVLIGAAVQTPQGENVGMVEDMILDTATGEVEYVVLSQDGSCGVNNRLVAVPASEFTMKGLRQLEVSETKDRLDKAPSFERADWPKIASNSWSTEIDAYYEAAAARRAGGEPKK